MSNSKCVYFCCDISGSMDSAKHKEAIKIINEYEEEEYIIESDLVVFTTVARTIDVEEYKAKSRQESGGTYISTGLREVFNNIMNKYYNVKDSDVTVAIICDGDNWNEDNERTFAMVSTLKSLGVKVKYHEIALRNIDYCTRMSERLIKAGVLTHNDIEIIRKPKNVVKKYSADIEVNGLTTVVTLSSNKVIISAGVSTCNPEDEFDESLGIKIATCRALGLNPFEKEEITDKDLAEYNKRKFEEFLESLREIR